MTTGFGEALRKTRIEAGMTQRDLAEVSGVHQTTISTAEKETRAPTIYILLGLCQGLNVTPDQLLQRAGLLEGDGPDEGFWELWGVWKRLPAEGREVVSEFARFWEGREG